MASPSCRLSVPMKPLSADRKHLAFSPSSAPPKLTRSRPALINRLHLQRAWLAGSAVAEIRDPRRLRRAAWYSSRQLRDWGLGVFHGPHRRIPLRPSDRRGSEAAKQPERQRGARAAEVMSPRQRLRGDHPGEEPDLDDALEQEAPPSAACWAVQKLSALRALCGYQLAKRLTSWPV